MLRSDDDIASLRLASLSKDARRSKVVLTMTSEKGLCGVWAGSVAPPATPGMPLWYTCVRSANWPVRTAGFLNKIPPPPDFQYPAGCLGKLGVINGGPPGKLGPSAQIGVVVAVMVAVVAAVGGGGWQS